MHYLTLIARNCRRYIPDIIQLRSKSGLGLWENDLNTQVKVSIENHWKPEVLAQSAVKADGDYYILSMFPYPSGQLHLGHVRVYALSDTIARCHRLNGKKVIHPMGWDSFGLPAENAAFEKNVLPENWTKSNIEAMKAQLSHLGFNFDWAREITTCKPDYYKWTQFIFLKLFENGLTYQSKALVNWDPVDQTVLADEQVDDNGCSWRSGAKVEKKLLNQWYIKTTKFAKQLSDGLDNHMLIDWKDIINLQKHWIGNCDGITIKLALEAEQKISLDTLDIWTSNPEKILYGKFIAISPDSILSRESYPTGVEKMILPIFAVNPINGNKLPIVVTEAVEYPEGRDVYIASPNICSKDLSLAIQLNLPIDAETSLEINPVECKSKVIEYVLKNNIGEYPVSSKLKDWLISRQRYWGTPIPIVHCDTCGAVPVPYDELPVELPQVESITPGVSPLAQATDWLNSVCPKCGSAAKRETDTMDTFVDSSWYFLRYLDCFNDKKPFDPEIVKANSPVDLYIGGKEHAVLHLYYARFMTYFFHSLNWTPNPEPFKRLLVQGMVMGKSYRLKSTGKYLQPDRVTLENGRAVDVDTGEIVETQWEKMSKSKYNGENPQALLSTHGCDSLRLFMLADVTPPTHRHWSDATFPGIINWQHRLWLTIKNLLEYRNNDYLEEVDPSTFSKHEETLWNARNYFTATTTFHYQYTHHISIAISRMQGLTNSLRRIPPEVMTKSKEFELALSALIIMLAPAAPHFCCELWSGLQSAPNRINVESPSINWKGNVFEQNWPTVDVNYQLSFLCKVDGANRCELKILPKDLEKMTKDDAIKLMLNQKIVAKRIKRGISKTVFEKYPGCRAILNIYTIQEHKEKIKKVAEASSE